MTEKENWSLVLKPKNKLLDIDLRELYRYRDLIRLFVNRDFVTVYKQTILGPLWFVLNPLFTTIVYTFVFSGLAKIPTDGVPPNTLLLWRFHALGLFLDLPHERRRHVYRQFGAVRQSVLPRLTVPISKAFSNLISAGIQLATLVAFYIYYALAGSPVRPHGGP